MMHRAFPVIVFLLMSLPAAGQGETAYVTDNLRLGIHQAEDTSDRAFRTLESGQPLEIISRNTNYANVRLPDGVEGYVKAAYLVYDKPAKLIVAESQAESEALRKELEDTRAAFASPAATIDSLEQKLATAEAASASNAEQVTALTTELDGLRGRQAQFKYSMPITWVGGAMFVCLLAGFLVGLWWVDRASRKRHGGIRIY
jgi:SH3 domain protein